ncbi:MAG: HAD family hydrolase [Vulcanimicrobiaceae bacterium]
MEQQYEAVCFDLFGTLTDGRGRAMDGALAALANVRGARWAIVTSAPRALATIIITEAGFPKPAALVSADDVERTKPEPQCYLRAAELLGVEPRRTLAIEDSVQGLAAARGAGMDTVMILRDARIQAVRDAVYTIERIGDLHLFAQADGGALLSWDA